MISKTSIRDSRLRHPCHQRKKNSRDYKRRKKPRLRKRRRRILPKLEGRRKRRRVMMEMMKRSR
jgi:hypothetical protein